MPRAMLSIWASDEEELSSDGAAVVRARVLGGEQDSLLRQPRRLLQMQLLTDEWYREHVLLA